MELSDKPTWLSKSLFFLEQTLYDLNKTMIELRLILVVRLLQKTPVLLLAIVNPSAIPYKIICKKNKGLERVAFWILLA